MRILMLEATSCGEDVSLDKFDSLGEVVKYNTSTYDEAVSRMKEHNPDVVIINKVNMTDECMSAAPNLKMVAFTATGYNNVDESFAKNHGICVANVAGYSTQSVIQHTFAMAFYLLEKLRHYDEFVKSGRYSDWGCFSYYANVFHELSGMTWGIVGLGSIGRGVAEIAEKFGCRVLYYSASGKTYDVPYEQCDLEELLNKSDIVSIHAPLNEYTNNMFDYKTISMMKRNAILLNLGRGPIVNEEDLTRALEEGLIMAAGLDVIPTEPIPKSSPLMRIKDSDKLLITPHIAWATFEARTRLLDEVYKNIEAFARGEDRNRVI